MSVIKFGTGQINNPTPAGINLAVRVFTITAGIFLGWMQTNNLFGAGTQNIISSILGLLLALVNGLAPLFGVDTTQQAIPRKDVAAMKAGWLNKTENEYARIKMKNSSGTYWDIAAKAATTNANGYFNLYFYNGTTGADKFSLNATGNLWIAGALTQNSDARLKKDISVIENSMQKLEQINRYHYNWKDGDRDSALQTGVPAQELEKVMPELVSANAKGIKSVNYSGLIPYLLEAIKGLQQEVDQLKAKK